MRWYDKKCVQMCSNYSDRTPTSTDERWDGKENEEIEISCPSIVAEYNTYMGRVDLSDMLISLSPTRVLVSKNNGYCIDIYKVNAWLIY